VTLSVRFSLSGASRVIRASGSVVEITRPAPSTNELHVAPSGSVRDVWSPPVYPNCHVCCSGSVTLVISPWMFVANVVWWVNGSLTLAIRPAVTQPTVASWKNGGS
jgi:hypothetical protein